ncbi:cupin domain-containing protein [Pseudoduganella chitinolytica]|uniref:Cupin domain-containing protein n=1 Tax=Pseudoduganella chitinolytica TaxID=34070 RepID=A0ABY8BBS2_9BURK|nr:cupin domain-containing protein [Pseudoduganella chitinolytica]WEF33350.1 cupin domain-containing protein [Pseudoduganella chitinolytica]
MKKDAPLRLLGDITPAQFMRDYWHKKPLLIRQAIPGFKPLLPFAQLAELATKDYVESRLVTLTDGQWDMQHGPLRDLPARTQREWTMLVQGVNLQDDAADALLRQFRFVPDARLDDLMVSFATDGGGVGPHFDSYDVFLLQAEGQRRWRIGPQKDLSLVEGLPLKILSNFEPTEEFVLEPGDMLYLPPHYAHDGVAIGDCQTYSIGFRSPSYQELGEAFLQFMADSIDLPGRYADPDLAPSGKPAEIPKDMLGTIADELNKMQFTEDDFTIFLGEYLSEPKHNVFFTGPDKPLPAGRFAQTAGKKGVTLSRKTQMLYRGKHVFINGESFAIGRADKVTLETLANERRLDGAAVAGASEDVMEALYAWYTDGWLELN